MTKQTGHVRFIAGGAVDLIDEGSAGVKGWGTRARDRPHCDDVDLNYLNVLGKEERSEQQDARWLDSADMHLAVAIAETDVIEKLL